MAWEMQFFEDRGFLTIKTEGFFRDEELSLFRKDILAAVNKQQARKVLVDHRDSSFEISLTNILNTPDFLKKVGGDSRYRVAMLYSDMQKRDTYATILKSSFTIANYKSDDNIVFEIFKDETAALEWLVG